jgi:hypothetical protein
MVSKLLLAVQENIFMAADKGADAGVLGRLIEHYYEIRAGIGINKSPKLYGAFPTDAYSHTPGNAGAQQPGLTGQVKEDVLNRWAELGIRVHKGCLELNPIFLSGLEFLQNEESYTYVAVDGKLHKRKVLPGQMAFTYCGTLVIYEKAEEKQLRILMHNGEEVLLQETRLNESLSAEIFYRTGKVKELHLKVCIQ